MTIKSFKEFNKEFKQRLTEKAQEELKFRSEHKANQQEKIVGSILLSLETQVDKAIKNACLDPVSAWESCHAFDSITKDDCKQIISGSLSQIEFELIQLGYKFEADILESNKSYQLIITLTLDVQDEPKEPEVPVSEIDIVALGAISIMLLNQ